MVTKKNKNSKIVSKRDYLYKFGMFLVLIGLLIMIFAMYLSFVHTKNLKLEDRISVSLEV